MFLRDFKAPIFRIGRSYS